MSQEPAPFLDVPSLLEASRHRVSTIRFWQLAGVFLLVVMVSTYFSTYGEHAAQLVSVVSWLGMILLVGVLMSIMWLTVRRARGEQLKLEAIDELLRLRRWPEAAGALEDLLGKPSRLPHVRVQGLIFLTSVLARYNRFDDAVTVQNFLLDNVNLDQGTGHGLRLARAMALLRQDHLFDADRSINELRNQVARAGRARNQQAEPGTEEPNETETPQSLSAGLALVEIYRDVKTGHPTEAIEVFQSTLPSLRDQLGHRVADAYGLAAFAYDVLGKPEEAQSHFENSTLLAPAIELHRRYPETSVLSQKYVAAKIPQEAA